MTSIDATFIEHKINQLKAKPNKPTAKAIKAVLHAIYSRLPDIMVKG